MSRSDDLYALPKQLPEPVDDGACDHLVGSVVPSIALLSTAGAWVSLAQTSSQRRVVAYCYPRTGVPHADPPAGWNDIPGARGCTPQTCGFRDTYEQFRAFGVQVLGVSTQESSYQREMKQRLGLPFEILSDAELALTNALGLPTFCVGSMSVLKRVTLILSQGRVEKVFYPVFPPDKSAEETLRWLQQSQR